MCPVDFRPQRDTMKSLFQILDRALKIGRLELQTYEQIVHVTVISGKDLKRQ